MGFLFDETTKAEMKKRDAAIEAMMDMMASLGEREGKEIKLIRTAGHISKAIQKRVVNHELTDSLTEEQLDEVRAYLEMVLAGFNTFMDQLESNIKKENPHSSGN